jgi:hypothetical protein
MRLNQNKIKVMKQFSRKEMMKFISKYMDFVSTTEDFFSCKEENEYSGGIWVSGDLNEKNKKFRGETIYNRHSILKSWEEYLNSKGWSSEWYDGGTVFIWNTYQRDIEDKLHQDAIDLMDDINKRLGTNHWMSLDEFYDEFSYQFTDEEEEKVTALLKRFEKL